MSDRATLEEAVETQEVARPKRFHGYERYVPVATSWNEKLPSHWASKRLRFVARVNPIKSELDTLQPDDRVSFVPMECVREYGGLILDQTRYLDAVEQGYTYFCEDDVVLAKITPCFENGKGSVATGLTNGVGFGTTELHVLRAGSELKNRYLFYATISHPFRKLGASEMYGAGGQKRVPNDFVRDFLIPLPSPDEQRAIATFLNRETKKIDELIEKKRKLIDLLREKKTALITHAVTKGLDPKVTLKPSGAPWLGEVPKHWEVLRVRHVITKIEQGWSPECENRTANSDEWAVMKAGCANYGKFDENDHKVLPKNLIPPPELEICSGDLLMSRACGTLSLVGSVALVGNCRPRLLLCDKLFRLRCNRHRCEEEYLYLLLNSRVAREQISQGISGADGLANNITQPTIKNIVIALPPLVEREEIICHARIEMNRLDKIVQKIQAMQDTIADYRSALISAAVTGKIDIRGEV